MQREILRRERWKRFLTRLQPSEAVGDSLAAMIFSWPPDLRRRLAYVLTGRPQRQQRERHHGAADEDEHGPGRRARRSE